jgi:nitroimidazol reductase NimA-like FMN-containing flavoprotein (pyridoxamine 5'-phosphate oxidase superfamily)
MQYDIKTMSQEEIDAFLASQNMGFLSLTDGLSPYAIPLAYIYAGGCIHITIRPEGRKWPTFRKIRMFALRSAGCRKTSA